MTIAPHIAPIVHAMEQLSREMNADKLAGIAIVGIRKDGSVISRLGMKRSLALAAWMAARSARLSRQEARKVVQSVIKITDQQEDA